MLSMSIRRSAFDTRLSGRFPNGECAVRSLAPEQLGGIDARPHYSDVSKARCQFTSGRSGSDPGNTDAERRPRAPFTL